MNNTQFIREKAVNHAESVKFSPEYIYKKKNIKKLQSTLGIHQIQNHTELLHH